MTRTLKAALVAALLLVAPLSGCVVRERAVARGPGGCPGGVWIEGHHGPAGRWHPGHWRCPGVREEVEVY